MLTKRWTVLADNQPHSVEVSWDMLATGGGRVVVDGTEQRRWLVGLKWPGVTKPFRVGSHAAQVVQTGVTDFEVQVHGGSTEALGRVPTPPEATKQFWLGLLLLLGPVVVAVVLGGLLVYLSAIR